MRTALQHNCSKLILPKKCDLVSVSDRPVHRWISPVALKCSLFYLLLSFGSRIQSRCSLYIWPPYFHHLFIYNVLPPLVFLSGYWHLLKIQASCPILLSPDSSEFFYHDHIQVKRFGKTAAQVALCIYFLCIISVETVTLLNYHKAITLPTLGDAKFEHLLKLRIGQSLNSTYWLFHEQIFSLFSSESRASLQST